MTACSFPEKNAISTHWNTESTNLDEVKLAVVIPTFKRPEHLARTLQSVIAQTDAPAYAIVVVDNHAEGAEGAEGAQAAQGLLETLPLAHSLTNPLTALMAAHVILAHRRGNCSAYNAGFHTALQNYPALEWIAIIDDDEIAQPLWLNRLLNTAQITKADFVGAPQHPVFEKEAFNHFAKHPALAPPYDKTGPVPILYSSGNVLLSAQRLKDMQYPWLDETFNFLGGGDSDFYARNKKRGAKFAYCYEAAVYETTPTRRTELSWLNARSLRNGSISALIQRRDEPTIKGHSKRIIKSLLLLAASPYRAFKLTIKNKSLIMGVNPMNVALGRLLMEFGFANEQYRAAEKN